MSDHKRHAVWEELRENEERLAELKQRRAQLEGEAMKLLGTLQEYQEPAWDVGLTHTWSLAVEDTLEFIGVHDVEDKRTMLQECGFLMTPDVTDLVLV